MTSRARESEPRVGHTARLSDLSIAVGHALFLTLLFGLALALRLHQLGAQPLWLDEGTSWTQVTRQSLGTLIVNLFRPTEAYPLYHLVLKVFTRVFGDSEWALRLPSALAGALAVPALYALGRELRSWRTGIVAATLLLLSPFAIWQAQDAKAYSLALLVTILLALALARALRFQTRSAWLIFVAVALVAPFVHRWLVFSLLGCAAAWSLDRRSWTNPRSKIQNLVLVATIAVGLALVVAITQFLNFLSAASLFGQVDPLRAAWLTFNKFAVDQYPGSAPRIWLLPFVLLTVIGLLRLGYDLRQPATRRGAIVVLALGGVPALLFALLFWRLPLYESRYLIMILPCWLLLMAFSFEVKATDSQFSVLSSRFSVLSSWFSVLGSWFLVLLFSFQSLYLPGRGLFSGAIVKENYREAVSILAEHVHPSDLVIVHPDTIQPLYDYYAPRVSAQPLPEPTVYAQFGRAAGFNRREFENRFFNDLATHDRAWLLVAPDHARLVDPPNPAYPDDILGYVGLAFQYGDRNGRYQCGEPREHQSYASLNGVMLYCNTLPTIRGADGQMIPPQPQIEQAAIFGDALKLRGYTIEPWSTGIRPGGTLPITLFWETLRPLNDTNLRIFVHLTRLDDPKPLAQADNAPLEGGLPTNRLTTTGTLLHDDRTLRLVDQETGEPVPPGRYKLWIGVYRAEDAAALGIDARLPVSGTQQPTLNNALTLGEIEVHAP